ncbi:hypothetical protein [Pseudomonas putida]|uniref:hypothetical protein n=1 Tax=Pseudomonas putida TaxID=303 RepID=UPI003D99D5C0
MDSKGSGTNLAFWLPGSAVILSLVVSMFALTREPFLDPRPIGAQLQAQLPIESRLWQDPFDAVERYRKKLVDSKNPDAENVCSPDLSPLSGEKPTPDIMVALIEGGPYADEVERRRRIRYALLAGFKNAHRVPDQEQYIHCLRLAANLSLDTPGKTAFVDAPYEVFVSNPFDPPTALEGSPPPPDRTIVFWLKQDALGTTPLQTLETLRQTLNHKVASACTPAACSEQPPHTVMKVIGPATSTVLRDMFKDQDIGKATPDIEIYSPLATADNETLDRGYHKLSPPLDNRVPMKLLRTVSDDGTMTQLILQELKLRRVDPATGVRCSDDKLRRIGTPCTGNVRRNGNRIALIAEWDSFYSRALIESFKLQVARDARLGDGENQRAAVDQWVLRFSYLRGLDGRLPEESASTDKTASSDAGKTSGTAGIDLSPLEKADGNAQLDYLRRLADHIASEDEAYRRNGESGIGAIGILGVDAYDKLLVLQALKSRLPYKLYFAMDLDARMLQRGQAQTTRNLILAAPYGLTLTRALQQDVPPFRDSLQSSVFISVLAALAPQSFDAKRAKFDYSKSELLSPGIYEVGISGFIPLTTQLSASRPASCEAPLQSRSDRGIAPRDLMALRCLQDPSPPPYPVPSQAIRERFKQSQSFYLAGPLTLTLLIVAAFIVWWRIEGPRDDHDTRLAWVRGVPITLFMVAAICAFIATRFWHAEFLWFAFVLILLGIVSSNLTRRSVQQLALARDSTTALETGSYDSRAWYIVVPLVMFILALMLAYQMRSTLTDNGLGEPMFLFEGISAWPTVALRLLAVLISLSALTWGWRKLRINRAEIETAFHLRLHMRKYETTLWGQVRRLIRRGKGWTLRRWCSELGHWLLLIFFPLMSVSDDWSKSCETAQATCGDGRRTISIARFWGEHCICGSFGARMLRAVLATWVYVVVTSVLFVVWPMEGMPVRGQSNWWMLSWLMPTLIFQVLVFWVMDANLLLTRFIRHLSEHHAIWPGSLQAEHKKIFGMLKHPCIDEWVDLQLIARRTSAVNRLIYAPTVVMLILLASRSSLFDNWPTPPGLIISYLLTALLLLTSALTLRRAAEKARTLALQRLDAYLLETAESTPCYGKFKMIRERVSMLNAGSFSRYSDDPLIRALLLSLTGIGGSAIVDALNFAKF